MEIKLERRIIRQYKLVRNLGDVQVGVPDATIARAIRADPGNSKEALWDLANTVKSFALNIYETANRISRPSEVVPDILPNFAGDGDLFVDDVRGIAQEIQSIAAGVHKNLSRVEPFSLYEYDMLGIPGVHQRMLEWDLSRIGAQVDFFSKILYPMAVATSGPESGISISDFMSPRRITVALPSSGMKRVEGFEVHDHLEQLRKRCSGLRSYIDVAWRRDQLDEMLEAFDGLTSDGVDQLLEMATENENAPLSWILSSLDRRVKR